MVFLLGNGGTDDYTVFGTEVGLRPLRMSDHVAWSELRAASRSHLTPFEPQWAESELSRASFRLRVRIHQREMTDDTGYAFGIFSLSGNALVGGISLSNVRRGVTQSAELGYWLGRPYTGHGYMTQSVRLIVAHAFGALGLHRVEAATLPHNAPSIRVLERNGFKREGEARSYLKIDGRWQDHLLFGLIEDDFLARAADCPPDRPAFSTVGSDAP